MDTKFYKKGVNLENVQELNRSLVLRLIRRLNVCSRATIAKETGLKQSTITNIVNGLIDWGLVKETGIIDGEKGRRSIGITLNNKKYKVIGLRLTRHYYSIGLFDLSGKQIYVKTKSIDILGGSKVALQDMEKSITEILESSSKDKIIGIGLAIPGPFLKSEGRIVLMSEFPGWEKINLEKEIESRFEIPVYLEHDANAGALAEWWSKPHNEVGGTLIYIAAGQGIGAGIIIDGKLFRGSLGIAGEIGHMSVSFNGPRCDCGQFGCLEMYCSTIVLEKKMKNDLKNYPNSILNKSCDLESIIKAVNNNDEYAKKVFEKVIWYLCIGIANIINIFNPDLIIVGDELARFGDNLLNYLKKSVKKLVLPSVFDKLSIELSTFKNDPALIGASDLVIDKILSKPSIAKKLL